MPRILLRSWVGSRPEGHHIRLGAGIPAPRILPGEDSLAPRTHIQQDILAPPRSGADIRVLLDIAGEMLPGI